MRAGPDGDPLPLWLWWSLGLQLLGLVPHEIYL